MAKPDDRTDNVNHLQRAIANTMENMRETNDFLKAHDEEIHSTDREALQRKNERREQAIEGFREEIQDEVRHEKTNFQS